MFFDVGTETREYSMETEPISLPEGRLVVTPSQVVKNMLDTHHQTKIFQDLVCLALIVLS